MLLLSSVPTWPSSVPVHLLTCVTCHRSANTRSLAALFFLKHLAVYTQCLFGRDLNTELARRQLQIIPPHLLITDEKFVRDILIG